MSAFSRKRNHLGPVLKALTDAGSYERSDGINHLVPIVALSDGSRMKLGRPPQFDGKGKAGSVFVPRVGVVPTANDPVVPVTTPRHTTVVRPGGGIVPNLTGPAIIALVVVSGLAQAEDGTAEVLEDAGICDDLLTSAKPMLELLPKRIRPRVVTRPPKPGAEPRTRIFGYSRKTP